MARVKNERIKLWPNRCIAEQCELLGKFHPKCTAHTRAWKPCKRPRMEGQFVCRMHGGLTDTSLKNGEIRLAMTVAQSIVAYDPEDDEPILDGLIREVRHSSQIAKAWALVVAELEDKDIKQRTPRDGEKLAVAIEEWRNERMAHARLAKMALDAGVERRQLELAEAQAQIVVYVLAKVFSDPTLELTPSQVIDAKSTAARILRDLPQLEKAALGHED